MFKKNVNVTMNADLPTKVYFVSVCLKNFVTVFEIITVCMFDIFSLRPLNLPIIENYYVLEKKNHVLFMNGIPKPVISLM